MASEESALDAATEHVRAVVAGARTSFYWAMRILPPARRDAIYAVYAFCREVDDIADGEAPEARKIVLLAAWQNEIDALFAGAPTQPTTRALAPAVTAYGLEQEPFSEVIRGMEMDARGPIRAPSWAELETYCGRVASAVGLLCIRIFGEGGAEGRAVAKSLGLALQLTNILRDLREDADMGRLYLPREALVAHGIETTEPEEVLRHPGLAGACFEVAARAEAEFAEARAAIARCDARAMRPAVIMMHVYYRTLRRLKQRGWRDAATYRPGKLAKFRDRLAKAFIALRYGLF